MTTLTDIRDRVRQDLDDTDTGNERWSDSQLNRHIERALRDLSLAIPREETAVIATTAGSRDISLAGIAGLMTVEAVEFPVDMFPATYARFSRWDDMLTLLCWDEPDGSEARIFYTASHTLDGSGSTLPAHLEDVVATGASGYAALERSIATTDALNTGGSETPANFGALGRAWLTAFQQLLSQHARERRVRNRRLYRPA